MAWLEQCDVCGGGGFFCCRHNSHPPDLNQEAAGAACPHEGGGPGPGLASEFQFLGRPGGGVGWLLGDACRDGEVVSEDIRRPPPIVPTAVWDADCRYGPCSPRWPILDSCSTSGSSKTALAEAAVDGAAASAGAAVSLFDASNAMLESERTASSGKDESSSTMDREARVLRYREKKKRRKFGKQIRYASRKAYAEARPRIRGRFVKAPEEMPAQPPAPLPPRYVDAQQMDMGWLRAFRP